MSFLSSALIKALNHVASQERWAAERLRPFAGGQVALYFGEFEVGMAIDGEGKFAERSSEQPPTVSIMLPADTPVLAVSDPQRILGGAKISGQADFAEVIGFVFRNLKWDAEADLAAVFGDIVAHRAHKFGTHAFTQIRESTRKAAGNIAEYLGEESGLLVSATEMADFSAKMAELNDALSQLEKRIARL